MCVPAPVLGQVSERPFRPPGRDACTTTCAGATAPSTSTPPPRLASHRHAHRGGGQADLRHHGPRARGLLVRPPRRTRAGVRCCRPPHRRARRRRRRIRSALALSPSPFSSPSSAKTTRPQVCPSSSMGRPPSPWPRARGGRRVAWRSSRSLAWRARGRSGAGRVSPDPHAVLPRSSGSSGDVVRSQLHPSASPSSHEAGALRDQRLVDARDRGAESSRSRR